jgi:hypothetical protein
MDKERGRKGRQLMKGKPIVKQLLPEEPLIKRLRDMESRREKVKSGS